MKKLGLSLLALLLLCSCGSYRFDQDAWSEHPKKRNGMVQNLIDTHKLEGMTETDIVDLLGEPEQRLDEPGRQLVYYLGRAGLGVDDKLFKLYFDANGKLERHEITQD